MSKTIELRPQIAGAAQSEYEALKGLGFFKLHVAPTRRSVRLFISGSVQPKNYESENARDTSRVGGIMRAMRLAEAKLECKIFLTGFDLSFDLVDLDGNQEDLEEIDPIHRSYLEGLAIENELSKTRKDPKASAELQAKISVPGVSLTGKMAAPAPEESETEINKTQLRASDVKFVGKPVADFDGVTWFFSARVMETKLGPALVEKYGNIVSAMDVVFEKAEMGRLKVTGTKPAFSAVMRKGKLDHAFGEGKTVTKRQSDGAILVVNRLTKALEDGYLTFSWEAEDGSERA